MTRTHPPTLRTLGARALRDEILLDPGATVLVGVSGGPDSMALVDVLASLARSHGFALVAHGIDHGLRREAARELALAEALCTSLEVPFGTTHLRVDPGSNLQARARAARHAALEQARRHHGADVLATAHHADDRAETVVMRMLRGAGPAGLAVLPPRDGRLIRPFVRAHKRDILLHLERHHICFAHDPSNDDPRFLRTRVRREVLPLLATLDPHIVEHLCALADDLGELRDGVTPYIIPRAASLALRRLAAGKGGSVRLPGGIMAKRERSRSSSSG